MTAYKDTFDRLAEEMGAPVRPRLVRVPLAAIRIDPHAPRQVLPDDLQRQFLAGEIDGREAMTALLRRAETGEQVAILILEGTEKMGGLRALAESIRRVGLRQPLTGYLIKQDGRPLCQLAEGQRRYWAHHLLVQQGHAAYNQVWMVLEPWPEDEVLVVERQLAENQSRRPLSDIALARGMARLRQLLAGRERS
jgi:hypothetical protein